MKTKTIGLDYDIPISEFNKKKFMRMMHYVPNIDEIFYRRSPGGNTHIRLYPVLPVPLFRALQIRAFLQDDEWRVMNDLKKLYLHGDMAAYDILFDEHFKDKWRKAGEWKPILFSPGQ